MYHGFLVASVEYDFASAPERGYTPSIIRAIKWVPSLSGTLVPSDMGADYDAHEADITIITGTAEAASVKALLASYKGAQVQYRSPAGVYPFGPHIDSVSGYVYARIVSVEDGGRIARTAPYWQIHVRLRLDQAYIPTSASTPAFLSAKYATPSVRYPMWVKNTAAGRAVGAGRTGIVYGCRISADALSPAKALEAANWALWVRAGVFTYTPPTGLLPFGAGQTASSYQVRLSGFSIQKYKPHLWFAELDLARSSV